MIYTFNENIDVPRGNVLSPVNRSINYWRQFSAFNTESPASPTALSASGVTNSTISLKWTDNANNELGFRIYRSLSATSGFNEIATVAANITTYADNSLQPGTPYYYRIMAYNATGNSEFSPTLSIATLPEVIIPDTPGDLSAEMTDTRKVKLTWNDQSDNEDGFVIERTGPKENVTATYRTQENDSFFTDMGVIANSTYTYKIRAINKAGSSPNSQPVQITTSFIDDTFWRNNILITSVSSDRVVFAWTNYPVRTKYTMERRMANESRFVEIGRLPYRVNIFADATVIPATAYIYRIRTVAGISGEMAVTTNPEEILPPVPVDLMAEILDHATVKINWTDPSDNEAGFLLERSGPDDFILKKGIVLAPDDTTHTDAGLLPGSSYQYRICTLGSEYPSPFSQSVDISTPIQVLSNLPSAPSGPAVSATAESLNNTALPTYVSERYSDSLEFTISLYPNPAIDEVYLRLDTPVSWSAGNGDVLIRLVDMYGRVKNEKAVDDFLNTGLIKLDISQLYKGLYFIQVWMEGKTNTRKLIIEK
jgi:titin